MVATLATRWAYTIARPEHRPRSQRYFRYGQLASASLVSLAHGTNDAQKTMGIVTLALIADHQLQPNSDPPAWVIVACAVAIAAGTYLGGWRVIQTMGHRITHIEPPQGFAAQNSAAVVLLVATQAGLPLSTTHITSGAVLGSGVGKKSAQIRWGVARSMVVAWVLTLPAAALVSAGIGYVVDDGGTVQIAVVLAIAVLALFFVWLRARRNPVNADNVNDIADRAIDDSAHPLVKPPDELEQKAS